MGASFRNLGQICELAGCDLLTIAPKLLTALQATEGNLPRKLAPETAAAQSIDKLNVDEATFLRMHAEDRMATEKLSEGITGFSQAIVALERLLGDRLAELEGASAFTALPERCLGCTTWTATAPSRVKSGRGPAPCSTHSTSMEMDGSRRRSSPPEWAAPFASKIETAAMPSEAAWEARKSEPLQNGSLETWGISNEGAGDRAVAYCRASRGVAISPWPNSKMPAASLGSMATRTRPASPTWAYARCSTAGRRADRSSGRSRRLELARSTYGSAARHPCLRAATGSTHRTASPRSVSFLAPTPSHASVSMDCGRRPPSPQPLLLRLLCTPIPGRTTVRAPVE